jgi:hypothetical protein|tara:strand:- start:386 stop:832 length:447 start_codon:yes stop_codon:yes gene_type:complete
MKYLEQILQMWEKDSKIDNTSLDESSRQSPVLHAKYLPLLAEAKIALRRAHAEQKVLLKQKWLYYNGKMNKEQIEAHGWDFDPFEGLRVLKGEMDYYYDADTDIQASEQKIDQWKITVETLTEIVDNIKWRHQTIGNMIKWRMFEAGG